MLFVPPQHGKSTLCHHWLVRLLGRYPHLNHAYVTYGQKLSNKQSRRARRIARGAELELEKDSLEEWVTADGGGCIWTSIGGQITGDPVSGAAVVDDPFRGRKDAESQIVRETTNEFYEDDLMTRIHPTASEILINTRWHVDDLAGTRLKKDGRIEDGGKWKVINLQAISTLLDGTQRALWEEGRPLAWLQQRRGRMTEYAWWSLYMGEPRPRGSALFGLVDTCRFDELPKIGRVVIGIDLAYTKKTRADYTAVVVLLQAGDKAYVLDAHRWQAGIEESTERLGKIVRQYPGAPIRWDASGTEIQTVARRLRGAGIRVQAVPALLDKFVRAGDAAADWKSGKIIVPRDASWAREFTDEVQAFTGVNDTNDDWVDALVSAHAQLLTGIYKPGQQARGRTFGSAGGTGWGGAM